MLAVEMSEKKYIDVYLVCREIITSDAAAVTCNNLSFNYLARKSSGPADAAVRCRPDDVKQDTASLVWALN